MRKRPQGADITVDGVGSEMLLPSWGEGTVDYRRLGLKFHNEEFYLLYIEVIQGWRNILPFLHKPAEPLDRSLVPGNSLLGLVLGAVMDLELPC
jgi:hypothetical protein